MHPVSLFFVAIFAILLNSCATTTPPPANYYDATVQSWQGSPVQALLQHWGEPDSKTITPQGYMTYSYQKSTYHLYPPSTTPMLETTVTASGKNIQVPTANPEHSGYQTSTCTASFETNNRGIIIATHTQGKHCIMGTEFVKKMANPRHPVTKQFLLDDDTQ